MPPPRSDGFIFISNIKLGLEHFHQPVDQIAFEDGMFKKEVAVEGDPGEDHSQKFDPPLKLPTQDKLIISVRYTSPQNGTQILPITVDLSEAMTNAKDDGSGKEEYIKSYNNIEVAITITSPSERFYNILFPSIPKDILSVCPRFRVLVIGNSGAGKSTLIQTVFGVKGVDISHSRRGKAAIGQEFFAEYDLPFVLHDSLGFEAGERLHITEVLDFVEDRVKKESLKERLHAVWVCLAVPYAKGRFTEAGTEDFLRARKERMGNVPVIVALTQADLLDKLLIMNVLKEGARFTTLEDAQPYISDGRKKFLHNFCTTPLLKQAGEIPHVPVSADAPFDSGSLLTRLMDVTVSEIVKFMRTDPTYAKALRR